MARDRASSSAVRRSARRAERAGGIASTCGVSVEIEGGREIPVRVDLRLQIRDFLFRGGNGIGARDETARRRLLARNPDERTCELRRVPGLLAVLGLPVLDQGSSARIVVGDGRLGVVRRLLREEFR